MPLGLVVGLAFALKPLPSKLSPKLRSIPAGRPVEVWPVAVGDVVGVVRASLGERGWFPVTNCESAPGCTLPLSSAMVKLTALVAFKICDPTFIARARAQTRVRMSKA